MFHPPGYLVDADDIVWAQSVGGLVAKRWGWSAHDQESADLKQTAVLTLLRKAVQFDWSMLPAGGDARGLFRGWVRRDVVSEVERESHRLLNGGVYRTRRRRSLTKGFSFSDLFARSGTPFDLADAREDAIVTADDPAERPPVSLTDHEDTRPATGRSVQYLETRPRSTSHADR